MGGFMGGNDLNLGDLDKFFSSQPGGVVGKGSRPRPAQRQQDEGEQRTSEFKATLKDWVAQMDKEDLWPEFDKKVQDFAQKFEVPYPKAVIYLLFNVF